MKKVLDQVAQAAETDSIVHIEGETGTGKELIAKALHVAGPRKEGPFVAVNCAAVPETLMESEFFGYEKGAFTGAIRNKKGWMAQADGGTLFLDEISEMPVSLQAKLLRVLEEKQFYPLGSPKTVKTDARFIVASNRDLEEMVRQGTFREDLFYRIHVIPVRLPPLRERKEDVALLARHFLTKYRGKTGKEITGFTPSAIQKLMLHDWPGNVRELENAIEYAVAMASADQITDDLLLRSGKPESDALKSLKDAKEEFERNYLIQLLELTSGNVTEAAKLAGKYRADFYELLRKYQLDPARYRNS
jgi:two-component system response regulator GlrR